MIEKLKTKEKNIHHANIILGGDCKKFVFEILEKDLDFVSKGNPDFMFLENESFGIDDARNLENWAIGKPLGEGKKVFFIITRAITHEAQNALLKVFEEPPANTYFFVALENLGGILPTFISRVRVLNIPSDHLSASAPSEPKENPASKFLRSKINSKLSLIRSLSKKEDKSKMKELIKDLENIYSHDFIQEASGANSENMKKILTAKIFASARGSSPKMLLEWLSCVLS